MRFLRPLLTLSCLILLAQLVGVCSYASRPSSEREEPRLIVVENRNWETASIYVLCEHSTPRRVSQIETFGRREVRVRKTPCEELTLRVELSPSGAVLWAPPVSISPGDCLHYTIQNNYGTSAWGPCRRA